MNSRIEDQQTQASTDKEPAKFLEELAVRAGQRQGEISRDDCFAALTPYLSGEVEPGRYLFVDPTQIIMIASVNLSPGDLTMIRDLAFARHNDHIRNGPGETVGFFTEIAKAANLLLRVPELHQTKNAKKRQTLKADRLTEAFAETDHAAEMCGEQLSEQQCLQVLIPYLTGEADPSEISYGDPYAIVKGAAKVLSPANLRIIYDLALARLADDLGDGSGENAQFFTQAAKAAGFYLQNPVGEASVAGQDSDLSELKAPKT